MSGQLQIRTLVIEGDLDSFLAVRNESELQPLSAEQWRARQARVPPARFERFLVGEIEGQIVATGWLREHELLPGHLLASVKVLGRSRGRGTGSALAARLMGLAREWNPEGLEAHVLDDDPGARAWAEHRHFELADHRFNSRLELAAFADAGYQDAVSRMAERGIRIEPADDHDRVYELYARLMADTPDEVQPPDRDFYDTHLVRDGVFRLVARAGERWVGIAIVEPMAPDGGYNSFTGVIPAARGRGVATALKVAAIQDARRRGMAWLTATNNVRNASMLAINEALGYRRLKGVWIMRRRLGREPGC
ncbi:MAG: GNAT family N-acetyltransferase [Candidatus Dormibacteraeota bacterium]|nr:GNAT family N-acetyltransferase [Candidatus Dormibacteraeota bacterium]